MSLNSTARTRWNNIFRHEFVMLIWLAEHGYESTSSKKGIFPSRVFSDMQYCYCGLEKANPEDNHCYFCGDLVMALTHERVTNKSYAEGMLL